MKIASLLSDGAILQEIGERLHAIRLENNLTQATLAEKAGVAKRTIERLESGAVASQLSAFLRVCRALGLLTNLDVLIPERQISPMQLLKLQKKRRVRASGKKIKSPPLPHEWKWDDKS